MEVIEFIEFVENSSANSFLAKCSDDKLWIVRCKKKDKNSKRLFSEYVAGILAEKYGISHPQVNLVKVPSKFISMLNNYNNIFDEHCFVGVATFFIEELRRVKGPKVKSFLDPTFPKVNIEYLKKELSEVKNFEQLYALKVFSHWIYLSDYHKYENLQITSSNKIIFLDFDFAFSSDDNSWGNIPEYDFIRINTNQAPFWEGLTDKLKPFTIWLEKLGNLSSDNILNKIQELPECWNIPEKYLKDLLNFMFNNRDKFIEEFKHSVDFQKDLKAFNAN